MPVAFEGLGVCLGRLPVREIFALDITLLAASGNEPVGTMVKCGLELSSCRRPARM